MKRKILTIHVDNLRFTSSLARLIEKVQDEVANSGGTLGSTKDGLVVYGESSYSGLVKSR